MSLKDKLNESKKQFEITVPTEALAIMHLATDDLRHSGIMEGVLKVGDCAPDITLPDEQGQTDNSTDLQKKKPLAVSFYRGMW